ncbi:MAG TPA: helix-turn-helix transcriptional regulator [Nitrolancea sp.]|nr:helix-turn-helix transcriptional regulator [Nitrolancea sp.]
MKSDLPDRPSDADYPISLGKVVRHLRVRHKLTQDQLAESSRMNTSRLRQIERGAISTDDALLTRIASALGIELAEIQHLANKTLQERMELLELLELLAIPRENWDEFLALDLEARSALIDALRLQLPARAGILDVVDEIANAIERDGVEECAGLLLDGILQHGLPPLDYLRSSVQMDEMPGERIIFSDRLPISPAVVPIDELFLFRASYGIDPSNPKLLKWWSDTRRTAVVATVQEYGSRTIVPIDRLARYINVGERGPNIVLSPEVVRAHLVAVINLLRNSPKFMLGLAEGRFPVTYRMKGDRHVIVSLSGYVLGPNPQKTRMTLRFSRESVAKQFRRHFESTWQAIPEPQKDSANVADWLERQLPNVGRGERR